MEVYDLVNFLEDKYNVKLYLNKEGDKLILSSIVVPKSERGIGIGKQVMQEITDYADEVGINIYLTPSTGLGASSIRRLEKFYKGFGFEKKPKSDFSTRHSMVRYPYST